MMATSLFLQLMVIMLPIVMMVIVSYLLAETEAKTSSEEVGSNLSRLTLGASSHSDG